VCAKQIPDPETPSSAFKIDAATNRVIPSPQLKPVLSQFDGIAAEAALRIKERDTSGGTKITVLSLGAESAAAAIKQVLAMGADEGVLLNDPGFEDGDSYTTAHVLAAAIRRLGDVDGVFCGRQAADWDMGQVGLLIAGELGWPVATIAKSAELHGAALQVQRVLADGFETVSMPLPAVVTVSNEFGDPRYPKLPQIMAAAKKTVTTWRAPDLNLGASEIGRSGSRLRLDRLFIPQRGGKVELMPGTTVAEQAAALVDRLREARIL
jgi:electron transfer flavoprotein beta subunit